MQEVWISTPIPQIAAHKNTATWAHFDTHKARKSLQVSQLIKAKSYVFLSSKAILCANINVNIQIREYDSDESYDQTQELV